MAQAGSVAGGFLERARHAQPEPAGLAKSPSRNENTVIFRIILSLRLETRLPSYPASCVAHGSVRTRLPLTQPML